MSARQTLARRLRFQADACARLGSRLYADLLRRSAREVVEGEVLFAVLAGHEDDPGPSALALRLMGAVHRLVLSGRAPELAKHYPSAGGAAGDAWPAFLGVLHERRYELRELLERPVQTNEPARCAALLGGFLAIARATGLPLRLLEVGASAGLNLRFDHYRYEFGDGRWGLAAASPVTIRARLTGTPPLDAPLRVASRAGCDTRPLDPRSDEDRLTLASYVWPDQVERHDRLRAALRVAEDVETPIDRAGAADWTEARLAERPGDGVTTVVFHSIVMQYLPTDERERFERALENASGPLAWLRMEPGDENLTEVRLKLWPEGEDRLLARAGYHGDPVDWLASTLAA